MNTTAHTRHRLRLLTLTTALLLGTASASADGFARFEGVDGEATERNHAKWIQIQAFSKAAHLPAPAGGASRRRGSASFEPIRISKRLDSSSPQLEKALATGRVFPRVILELTSPGRGAGAVYYRVELRNVLVTSYQLHATGDAVPTEELTISYEEIKVSYMPTDAKGRKKGSVEFQFKTGERR
ncbi:MAG: type VI secretion system tube protein Hcp [Myxococcales bacterium]|jgi:type VI secretion system secreted protein Hcp